jgi:hypothetical protein
MNNTQEIQCIIHITVEDLIIRRVRSNLPIMVLVEDIAQNGQNAYVWKVEELPTFDLVELLHQAGVPHRVVLGKAGG